jgi:hypothetical protein
VQLPILPTSFDLLWSLTARRRRGDDPHDAADPLDLADRADPSLYHVAQAIARTFAAGRCLNAITVFCTVGTRLRRRTRCKATAGVKHQPRPICEGSPEPAQPCSFTTKPETALTQRHWV